MLRRIIRDSLIRLYDISAVMLFSAAVNIITWGVALKNNRLIYLCLLISSFSSLTYSGWCFYWLCKEVERCIRSARGMEIIAVKEIEDEGMSFNFRIHFVFAIIFFVLGIVCFFIFVSANENVK